MAMHTTTLDPIPTVVHKECLPSISPLILNIVKTSLTTNIVPEARKVAAITLVLHVISLMYKMKYLMYQITGLF